MKPHLSHDHQKFVMAQRENKTKWQLSVESMKILFMPKGHFLHFIENKNYFILIVIFAVSLLLKLLLHQLDPVISRDGILYVLIVQDWHDLKDVDALVSKNQDLWVPLFPLFLMKSLMQLGLSAENAGVLLNIIAGSLVPLVIYGLALEISRSRGIALCSALFAAFHPAINELSIQIQRDMIYLFFAGCIMWAFYAGLIRQKWYYFCCSGFLSGLSLLTRFESFEFPLFAVAACFFLAVRKNITWSRSFYFLLVFMISLILSFVGTIFLMGAEKYTLEKYYVYGQWKVQAIEQTLKNMSMQEHGTE